MATFSVNQTRQFYVANARKAKISPSDSEGTLEVKNTADKSTFYFAQVGAGGIVGSDKITTANVVSIKATDADSMAHSLLKYKISLDTTVSNGAPIGGQDYILKMYIRNFVGLGDALTYQKFGAVHAYSEMTSSDFYKKMVISCVKNFSRETNQFFKFYLEVGGIKEDEAGTLTLVTNDTKENTLSDTYTGIVIEEAPQDWQLGIYEQTFVNFDITGSTVNYNSDEVNWAIVARIASTSKIDNGKKIADMEYFYMGERADKNRMVGFPHVNYTKYLVNPNIKYNTIDITYFYAGNNEDVQKSQKSITLAIPKVGATNSVSNKLTNEIIEAITTASGISINKLEVQAE